MSSNIDRCDCAHVTVPFTTQPLLLAAECCGLRQNIAYTGESSLFSVISDFCRPRHHVHILFMSPVEIHEAAVAWSKLLAISWKTREFEPESVREWCILWTRNLGIRTPLGLVACVRSQYLLLRPLIKPLAIDLVEQRRYCLVKLAIEQRCGWLVVPDWCAPIYQALSPFQRRLAPL